MLPEVKAVATIASPSTPQHVRHLLKSGISEIKENGMAQVDLGGRSFTIKEQFLKDLETKELKTLIRELDVALLIMHAPQDSVVGIQNAEELYQNARHPKSFVSLDGADHLLSNAVDSEYAGEVIASWASRYLSIPQPEELQTEFEVVANLGEEGFTTQLRAGKHYFLADEPEKAGGNGFGPTPYDYISAALAACTSMTIQMYARRKKWPLKNVETHVNHQKSHARDCENCERNSAKIDLFERRIEIEGNLDDDQRTKILEIADKCPVHRTLHNKITTKTALAKA